MDRIQEIIEEGKIKLISESNDILKKILVREFNSHKKLCKSPIEQMFLFSWMQKLFFKKITFQISSYSVLDSDPWFKKDFDDALCENYHENMYKKGYRRVDFLIPQYKIGKYTADFLLVRHSIFDIFDHEITDDKLFIISAKGNGDQIYTTRIIVECDGHNFHEKTKEQAQHDKERDRYIQDQGFNILRFTGSEIYKNPFNCSNEVDNFLNNQINEMHYRNEVRARIKEMYGDIEYFKEALKNPTEEYKEELKSRIENKEWHVLELERAKGMTFNSFLKEFKISDDFREYLRLENNGIA